MKVFYPGSFDPIHSGHLHIIERCLGLFKNITIGIGYNSSKKGFIPVEDRIELIKESLKHYTPEDKDSIVKVISYKDKPTAIAATELGCDLIIRGVRNISDIESESVIANVNRSISGIETLFFPCSPNYLYHSSSIVRELYNIKSYKAMTDFIPSNVYKYLISSCKSPLIRRDYP